MKKAICMILFFVVFTFCLTACNSLDEYGYETGNDEIEPVSSILIGEEEAKKITDKYPIHLYFEVEGKNILKMETRYINEEDAKRSVNNIAEIIVKELINGPAENSKLQATIPEGSKLRSPIKIKEGVATVDLTKEFVENHPGGKEKEQITIYSIVNSLTELKGIQKVKFTIDGKETDTFKGNFKFDELFPRSSSLISKEVEPISAKSSETEEDEKVEDEEEKEDDENKEGDETKEDKSSVETFEDSEVIYIETLE